MPDISGNTIKIYTIITQDEQKDIHIVPQLRQIFYQDFFSTTIVK